MSKDKDLSRIRSDSIWNALPPERRATFEGWLFEEHVSYATARERARMEWGVEGSLSSVGKYARRVARRRAVTDLEELTAASTEVDGAEGKLARLKGSAMKLVGMQLLEKALMRGDIKELAALTRVLTQVEDREIQRDRLELSREKFEFKAAEAALKEAPALNRIQQEKQKRKDAEIVEARLAIFGRPPPGYPDPCSIRSSGNQERRAKDNANADRGVVLPDGHRAELRERRTRLEKVRPHPGPLPQEREKVAGARDRVERIEMNSAVEIKNGEAPLPRPVASQARYKLDAPHGTCAPRNVVPTTASRGEGDVPDAGCLTRVEPASAETGSGVVTPERRIGKPGNQDQTGNDERENEGPSGCAMRVVDGTIPYDQEQGTVRNDQCQMTNDQRERCSPKLP